MRIAKFKDGSLLKLSAKKDYATAMVIEDKVSVNSGGFLNTSKRVAFLRGKTPELEALGLTDGCDINAKLKAIGGSSVKIVRRESTAPQFEGQNPKINPQTEAVITDDAGNPIYMQDVLVSAGSDEGDSLISTGVAEAISEEGDES